MSNVNQMKTAVLISAITCALALGGCAAVSTSIAHKDLDVQTKMSDTIFLDPVEPEKKVIYIEIRNTSDKTNFDIAAPVQRALQAKGYTITTNPKIAHYWLRANVLSVDKASPTAAQAALSSGFGGALAGAALGGTIGAASAGWGGVGYGAMAGGLAGAAIETIANAAVKDVTYMVITDVEIAEQAEQGVIVRQDSKQDAKQGIGGSRVQSSSELSDKKKYRTRIVSTANKVNLDYTEAATDLTNGLVRSISGLF
ncbi:MAG: complement resistance protein TraT [Methylovulum sp.]|nr:complement resistance protein TraT [Methylovulum sp.]